MEEMVEGLNRTMSGWANYFSLGQVSPAYNAVSATRESSDGQATTEAVRRYPAQLAEGMISSESRMQISGSGRSS